MDSNTKVYNCNTSLLFGNVIQIIRLQRNLADKLNLLLIKEMCVYIYIYVHKHIASCSLVGHETFLHCAILSQ